MTTEKTGQPNEQEEKGAAMGCCTPEKFAELMARCGEDLKCACGPLMQEMIKGGCCQPEQK